MKERQESASRGVSVRAVEIAVAAILMALGAVVMADSYRVGAGWAIDGPQAGYFPFYVGLAILVSSAVTLTANIIGRLPSRAAFVGRPQLKRVLQVLVPTAMFIVLTGFIGIYVAAALFIGFFMRWLGKYGARAIAAVAVLVPLGLFFMFEVWFLVPLPKGPIESFFGY